MEFSRIKESLLMRALAAAGVSALLTLAILASTATTASAYHLIGIRYDPNSINPISYRFFSVGALYETAFKDAEAVWDATSVPGYFQEQSWSWDPEVNVVDGDYAENFWAECTGSDANEDGLWDGNEVQIDFNTNVNQMGSLTAFQKKIVAEHELGHAYGLDENNDQGCVLMRQGWDIFTCGTMPMADDIDGVEAIYP